MFFAGNLHIKADYYIRTTTKITNLNAPKIYTFVGTDINTTKKLTIFNQSTTVEETQIGKNKSIVEIKIDYHRTKKKLQGFFTKTEAGNKLITLNHETKV